MIHYILHAPSAPNLAQITTLHSGMVKYADNNNSPFWFSGVIQHHTQIFSVAIATATIIFHGYPQNARHRPTGIYDFFLFFHKLYSFFLPWLKFQIFGQRRNGTDEKKEKTSQPFTHRNLPSIQTTGCKVAHLTVCAKSVTIRAPREKGGAGFGSPSKHLASGAPSCDERVFYGRAQREGETPAASQVPRSANPLCPGHPSDWQRRRGHKPQPQAPGDWS